VAWLVDRVAVSPEQLANLVEADFTLAGPAAVAAMAAGDRTAYAATQAKMVADGVLQGQGPGDLGGPAAAVEVALSRNHIRQALHHAERLSDRSVPELAARLTLSEALASQQGVSGDEAELIDRVQALDAARRPPGVQLALARILVVVGRLEDARDVMDGVLGLPHLGMAARRGAQLEALRIADLMDDLGTLNRVSTSLKRDLGAALGSLPCAQRVAALDFLSPNARLGPGSAFPLDGLKALAGTSLPELGACGELHLKIAQSLVDGGDADAAEALLDRILTTPRPPRDEAGAVLFARAQALRARTALQRGDRAGARRLLEEALTRIDDGDARHRLDQLRALSVGGPQATRTSAARLESAAMERAGELEIPLTEPIARLRRGLAAPLSEYFEVIFHERVDILTAEGPALSRSHWLMCFHDPDATQRYGEIPLTQGEEVIIARTWKVRREAGHLRLLPVESDDPGPDPEIVTLSALEPGDCAELLTLRAHGSAAPNSSYDGADFYFDDPRGPTHQADWVVLELDAAIKVDVELAPNTPDRPARALNSGRRYSFGPLPAFVAEDGDARPDRRRVSARARRNLDDQRRLAAMHTQIRASSAPTPSVRVLAGQAIRDVAPNEWPRALHRAVAARVADDSTPTLGADQQQSLNDGQGSRALVLLAAARALGLPAALWLARPLSDNSGLTPKKAPLPFDDFSWPLVVFNPRDEAQTIIDPRAATGLPAALVRGADALAIGGDAPPMLAIVPQSPTGRRVIRYHVDLQPDEGTYRCLGHEVLDGIFAESWRDFIRKIPAENRTLLMAHVARASFGDATTDAHVVAGIGMHDATLDWRFQLKGTLTTLSPERSELRVGLASDDPLGATGGLGVREHPLFFNQIADTRLELCVRWPADYRLSDAPTAHQIDEQGLFWKIDVELDQGDCALKITKVYRVAPRWIQAAEFREFRRLAAIVSQRDYIRIEVSRARAPLLGPRPTAETGPP